MKTIENHLLENLKEYLGFARRLLRDPELAADAVQESMIKALRAEAQIQDGDKAKAWFYRILRRTIIDLYRRRDARSRDFENLQRELHSQPSKTDAWTATAQPMQKRTAKRLDNRSC
ncbi:MAG: RNA polymerase sigma factor [Candidatus Binatia bacterium]